MSPSALILRTLALFLTLASPSTSHTPTSSSSSSSSSPSRSSSLSEWRSARATYYAAADPRDAVGGACGYGDLAKAGYGMATAGLSESLFERGQICGACFELRCVEDLRWCIPGTSLIVTATNFCSPNYGFAADGGGHCNPPNKHFVLPIEAFEKIAIWKAGNMPVQYRRDLIDNAAYGKKFLRLNYAAFCLLTGKLKPGITNVMSILHHLSDNKNATSLFISSGSREGHGNMLQGYFCDANSLNFRTLERDIVHSSLSLYRIKCRKEGGIRFTIDGSGIFISVLISNVAGAGDIAAIKIKGSKTGWLPMGRNWGQNWHINADLRNQPLSFEVSSSDGLTVTSYNVAPKNWNFGQTFEGKQFES